MNDSRFSISFALSLTIHSPLFLLSSSSTTRPPFSEDFFFPGVRNWVSVETRGIKSDQIKLKKRKMNRCDMQQNAMVVGCEEMRSRQQVVVSISDGMGKGPVFCPKPRRVGFSAGNLTMSLRWQRSQPADVCDSKAGAELLDIILMKRGFGEEEESPREIVSSNPFFCGSPPSRVSNPLVQDSNFGDEKLSPLSTLQLASPSTPSPSPSPSPSTMKAGCARMKFGLKQPAVRVEGFDCLSRDRQNSSITAVA